MRRLFAVTLLALALAPAAAAQTSSKAVVGVEPFGPGAPVAAGSPFEASITLRIKAGFHINAQKPTEDYLVGTSLKLNPPAGVTVCFMSWADPLVPKTWSFTSPTHCGICRQLANTFTPLAYSYTRAKWS